MTRTPADIDALMAAPKALAGELEWREDANTARLTAPVLVDGNVLGDLTIQISANIHTRPQRADITLVFEGRPVMRASFLPKHSHSNDNAHPTPPDLRLLRLPGEQSRLYGWADNRQWPRDPGRKLAARPMEPPPQTLAEAIDRFFALCEIRAHVPKAPWRPELFE